MHKLYKDYLRDGWNVHARRITGIGHAARRNWYPRHRVLVTLLEAFPHARAFLFESSGCTGRPALSLTLLRVVDQGLRPDVGRSAGVVEKLAEHYGVNPAPCAQKWPGLQLICSPVVRASTNCRRITGSLLRSIAAYLPRCRSLCQRYSAPQTSTTWSQNSDLPGFYANGKWWRIGAGTTASLYQPFRSTTIFNCSTRRRACAVAWLNPFATGGQPGRSHGQRIRSAQCKVRDNDVLISLNLPPDADIDLELWAAEAGGGFVPPGLRKADCLIARARNTVGQASACAASFSPPPAPEEVVLRSPAAEPFWQAEACPTFCSRVAIVETAPNDLQHLILKRLGWVVHGFGIRGSAYPASITTVSRFTRPAVPATEGEQLGGRATRCDFRNKPGVLAGVRTADCVPTLLADPAPGQLRQFTQAGGERRREHCGPSGGGAGSELANAPGGFARGDRALDRPLLLRSRS